jgi:hypothetical protein
MPPFVAYNLNGAEVLPPSLNRENPLVSPESESPVIPADAIRAKLLDEVLLMNTVKYVKDVESMATAKVEVPMEFKGELNIISNPIGFPDVTVRVAVPVNVLPFPLLSLHTVIGEPLIVVASAPSYHIYRFCKSIRSNGATV